MLALLWEVWEFVPGSFDAREPIRIGASLLLLVALINGGYLGGRLIELAEARSVALLQAFISGSLIHIVAFGVSHDHEKHVEPVAQFQDWGYRLGILIGLFLVFTSPQLAA